MRNCLLSAVLCWSCFAFSAFALAEDQTPTSRSAGAVQTAAPAPAQDQPTLAPSGGRAWEASGLSASRPSELPSAAAGKPPQVEIGPEFTIIIRASPEQVIMPTLRLSADRVVYAADGLIVCTDNAWATLGQLLSLSASRIVLDQPGRTMTVFLGAPPRAEGPGRPILVTGRFLRIYEGVEQVTQQFQQHNGVQFWSTRDPAQIEALDGILDTMLERQQATGAVGGTTGEGFATLLTEVRRQTVAHSGHFNVGRGLCQTTISFKGPDDEGRFPVTVEASFQCPGAKRATAAVGELKMESEDAVGIALRDVEDTPGGGWAGVLRTRPITRAMITEETVPVPADPLSLAGMLAGRGWTDDAISLYGRVLQEPARSKAQRANAALGLAQALRKKADTLRWDWLAGQHPPSASEAVPAVNDAYRAAAAAFQEALERYGEPDPPFELSEDYRAKCEFGRWYCLYLLGEKEKVAEVVEELGSPGLQFHPGSLARGALDFFRVGALDLAEKIARLAVDGAVRQGEPESTLYVLGKVLQAELEAGLWQSALSHADRGIEVAEGVPEGRWILSGDKNAAVLELLVSKAAAEANLGQFTNALATYGRLLEIAQAVPRTSFEDPEEREERMLDALVGKAQVRYLMGEKEQAIADIERLLEERPMPDWEKQWLEETRDRLRAGGPAYEF